MIVIKAGGLYVSRSGEQVGPMKQGRLCDQHQFRYTKDGKLPGCGPEVTDRWEIVDYWQEPQIEVWTEEWVDAE